MRYSILSFFITFVCALIIFGIGAMTLWNKFGEDLIPSFNESSNNFENTDPDNSTNNTDDPSNPDNTDEEKEVVGESFTILLNGFENQEIIDASILLRVDKENKRVVVASVNTQSQVYVGHTASADQLVQLGKLTKFKSILYTIEKIYSITGIRADYYINVDMESFSAALDTIYPSGYKYTIPVAMEYSDPEQDLEIKFTKGQVISGGEQILKALRYREDGSEKRMSRQREFVASFLKKAIPEKISLSDTARLLNNFRTLTSIVETNISADFITANIELIAAIPGYEFVFLSDGSTSQYIKYR